MLPEQTQAHVFALFTADSGKRGVLRVKAARKKPRVTRDFSGVFLPHSWGIYRRVQGSCHKNSSSRGSREAKT